MGIRLLDILRMYWRRSPIREIRSAMKRAELAGLEVAVEDMETHALVGGNLRAVVDAMIQAAYHQVEGSWEEFCALDLAGRNPSTLVKRAAELRVIEFETVRSDIDEPIVGNCKDGSPVRLSFRVEYRLPLTYASFGSLSEFPPRLSVAARAMQLIAESPSSTAFVDNKTQYEHELRQFAESEMKGIVSFQMACDVRQAV